MSTNLNNVTAAAIAANIGAVYVGATLDTSGNKVILEAGQDKYLFVPGVVFSNKALRFKVTGFPIVGSSFGQVTIAAATADSAHFLGFKYTYAGTGVQFGYGDSCTTVSGSNKSVNMPTNLGNVFEVRFDDIARRVTIAVGNGTTMTDVLYDDYPAEASFPAATLSDGSGKLLLEANGGGDARPAVTYELLTTAPGPTSQVRTATADGAFETVLSALVNGDAIDLAGHAVTLDASATALASKLNGAGELVIGDWTRDAITSNGGSLTVTGGKVRFRGGMPWQGGTFRVSGGSLVLDSGTPNVPVYYNCQTNPTQSGVLGLFDWGNGADPETGSPLVVTLEGNGGYYFGDNDPSANANVYFHGLKVVGGGFKNSVGRGIRPNSYNGSLVSRVEIVRSDLGTTHIHRDGPTKANDIFVIDDRSRVGFLTLVGGGNDAKGTTGRRRIAGHSVINGGQLSTLIGFEYGAVRNASTGAWTPSPVIWNNAPSHFESCSDGDASVWANPFDVTAPDDPTKSCPPVVAVRGVYPDLQDSNPFRVPGVVRGFSYASAQPSVRAFNNYHLLNCAEYGATVRGFDGWAYDIAKSDTGTHDPFTVGFGSAATASLFWGRNQISTYDVRGTSPIGNILTVNGNDLPAGSTVRISRFVSANSILGETALLLNHNFSGPLGQIAQFSDGVILSPRPRGATADLGPSSLAWLLNAGVAGAFQGVDRIGMRNRARSRAGSTALGAGIFDRSGSGAGAASFTNPSPDAIALTEGDPVLVDEWATLASFRYEVEGGTPAWTTDDQAYFDAEYVWGKIAARGTPQADTRYTVQAYTDYRRAKAQPTASAFLTAGAGGTPLGVIPPGGFTGAPVTNVAVTISGNQANVLVMQNGTQRAPTADELDYTVTAGSISATGFITRPAATAVQQIITVRATEHGSNPAVYGEATYVVNALNVINLMLLASGSTAVHATVAGKTVTVPVTVGNGTRVAVSSLLLSPSSLSVVVNNTSTITPTPKDSNGNALTGRTVTWVSSDTSKVTVNSSGVVTGVAAGMATITATCEGVSATSTATVTAAVSSDVVYATRLTRRASGDITTATPLTPAVVSAIAAVGVSQTGALRLVVTATGVEIPISAPTLLARATGEVTSIAYAIHEADIPVGVGIGGSVLTELRWSTTTPAPRSAAITPLAVPNGSNWPENAADLCASNLWGMPLIPYTQRGTVPSYYARLDDAYPQEHLNDIRDVSAAIAADPANRWIDLYRSGGQLMNDNEGQMISDGCRRGGTVGHEMFSSALYRMNGWCDAYGDGLYFWVNEPYPRPLSQPCMYWLTGADLWRQRTAVMAHGQISRARDELWQGGNPNTPYHTRTQQELRPLADAMFALAAAVRVNADLSTYPNAVPPGGQYASTAVYWQGLGHTDEIVAGVLGMQWATGSAYAGSWGGKFQTATTGANAPADTPSVKTYEAHLFHYSLITLYHMAQLSGARKAQIKAAVIAGTRYLNVHTWRAPGTNGPAGYYDYVWPNPQVTTDPGGHPVENDSGNGQYGVTVETTAYAGLPNAWSFAASGDTAFRDQCDAVYAANDDNRYGASGLTSYYAGVGQVKKMDQAHIGRASMLAFRFGNITLA